MQDFTFFCYCESKKDLDFFSAFISSVEGRQYSFSVVTSNPSLLSPLLGATFSAQYYVRSEIAGGAVHGVEGIDDFQSFLEASPHIRPLGVIFLDAVSAGSRKLLAVCTQKTIPYWYVLSENGGQVDKAYLAGAAGVVVDNGVEALALSVAQNGGRLLPNVLVGALSDAAFPDERGMVERGQVVALDAGVPGDALRTAFGEAVALAGPGGFETPLHPVSGKMALVTASVSRAIKAQAAGWQAVLLNRDAAKIGVAGYAGPTIVMTADAAVEAVKKVLSPDVEARQISTKALRCCNALQTAFEVLDDLLVQRWYRAAKRNQLAVVEPAPPIASARIFGPRENLHFKNVNYAAIVRSADALPNLVPPRLIVFCHDWGNMTGLAQSIKRYLAVMAFIGCEVIAIEVRGRVDIQQVLNFIRPDDFLLFNSLGIIERSDLFYQIATVHDNSKMAIYLHETEFVLEKFKATMPSNHALYKRLAPRIAHFAVSQKQRALLMEHYGVERCHLVYETTRLSTPDTVRPPSLSGQLMIVMVGTVQRRKGAELFSYLADLALQLGRPWKLYWVGQKLAEADSLYLSENVVWVGKMEGDALEHYVRSADVFFLASEDDPMPLAALEAIEARKPVICYEKTGTEELVRDLAGCAVYRERTPEAAVEAIDLALATELDLFGLARITQEISDEIAFSVRMTHAINAVFIGEG